MTIGDYIEQKMTVWGVDYMDTLTEIELQRIGLTADETMTADVNLDRFFYNIIPDILLMPKSVSEGGKSISYDKEAIESFYNVLAIRLELPNVLDRRPRIGNASNIW